MLDDDGAPERVVMHCFSGDVAFAHACAERDFFCSFAGNITYKRNDDLRDAARVVPEHLSARRNRRAVPRAGAVPGQTERTGAVVHTAAALASARSMSVEGLLQVLHENTHRAFVI